MKYSLRHSMKWSIFISAATFLLAGVFSVASTIILEGVVWGVGMLIVLGLMLVGIVFDMMGIASTAAKESPFHAMAAERVPGAKQSIYIVRHADRFSNFCNDVIGDISSIVSGAASALVVLKLMTSINAADSIWYTAVSVVFSALVSAGTVGGKALGKSYSIHHAAKIVLMIGKLFYILERHLGLRIFYGEKKKDKSGRRGDKRA